MDVRAAVAWEAGKPLSIETVQLAGPKAGEVLVEVKATGICHTDEFTHKVCCIGCGVTTGIGAVINTAKVEAGANVLPPRPGRFRDQPRRVRGARL